MRWFRENSYPQLLVARQCNKGIFVVYEVSKFNTQLNMQIGEFTLANEDKVERAINGTVIDQGAVKGGVGVDAEPEAVIAEYDRLGGLILKGKYKVKTGSFYDFKGKKPHAKPEPVLTFQVNDETIEVPADEPLPVEVRAAEIAKTKKQEKAEAKAAAKAAKKGKKANDEADEEDEEGELA